MVHSISLSLARRTRGMGERKRSILVNAVFVVAVIYYYSDAACLAVQRTAQREREREEMQSK